MRYLALLLFLATSAGAQEWRLFSLREFSLDVAQIADNRDPYYPLPEGEKWRGQVATRFDLDLARVDDYGLTWRNRIHTEGTQAQVRGVGWEWRLGMQIGPKVELYYDHHSRHYMEGAQNGRFPLFNSIGASFTFYRRDKW